MSRRKKDNTSRLIIYILGLFTSLKLIEYIFYNIEIVVFIVTIAMMFIYLKNSKSKELARDYKSIDMILDTYRGNSTGFEYYIANLYEKQGYKTRVTPPTNDGGKDIIMWKNGRKIVVEVKLYAKENKIGRPMIQKLHSAMIDCNANSALFVTTSDYTEPAVKYANKFHISIVNGIELMKIIKLINQ